LRFFKKKQPHNIFVKDLDSLSFNSTNNFQKLNNANPTQTYIITFGDGSNELRSALNRFEHQASETGWFKKVQVFNFNKLKKLDIEWYSKHIDFIASNHRGAGYWIWKPFIISRYLKLIPKNQFLVYADLGYEINKRGTKRFENYLEISNEKNLMAWEIQDQTVGKWTKGDALNYFNFSSNDEITNHLQYEFGLQVIKNTRESQNFYDELTIETTDLNYTLVNDESSIAKNPMEFIEHRHDQSIACLSAKKKNFGYFLPHESYFPQYWKKGIHPSGMPFATFRNKTETQKLSY